MTECGKGKIEISTAKIKRLDKKKTESSDLVTRIAIDAAITDAKIDIEIVYSTHWSMPYEEKIDQEIESSRSSGFDFVPTREEIIKDFAERATRSQKYLGELEAQQKYFRNLMNEYPEIGAVYERLCSDLEKWVIIDNAVVYIDDEEDTPAVSTCRGR